MERSLRSVFFTLGCLTIEFLHLSAPRSLPDQMTADNEAQLCSPQLTVTDPKMGNKFSRLA